MKKRNKGALPLDAKYAALLKWTQEIEGDWPMVLGSCGTRNKEYTAKLDAEAAKYNAEKNRRLRTKHGGHPKKVTAAQATSK